MIKWQFFKKMMGIPSQPITIPLPLIQIGRMAAEETSETVRVELMNEFHQIGWHALKKKIEVEQLHFSELQTTQKRWHLLTEKLSDLAVQRSCEGYSINGLYWKQAQEKLNQIATLEERNVLNEQLDWIKTRKSIFEELNSSLEYGEPQHFFYK